MTIISQNILTVGVSGVYSKLIKNGYVSTYPNVVFICYRFPIWFCVPTSLEERGWELLPGSASCKRTWTWGHRHWTSRKHCERENQTQCATATGRVWWVHSRHKYRTWLSYWENYWEMFTYSNIPAQRWHGFYKKISEVQWMGKLL